MSWFDSIKNGIFGISPADDGSICRQTEWHQALEQNSLPSFVEKRLSDAREGKLPWISTMTPAELLLSTKHKIHPIAVVSGTCWYHYGFSWTQGHSSGWHEALQRMRNEAVSAGANAIVDVKMKRVQLDIGESMDFTVYGTAVKIEGLPASDDPVVATVPALEFVRLLIAGIIPVGVAVGAHYDWYTASSPLGGGIGIGRWQNQPLTEIGDFWEHVRRLAIHELIRDTKRLGDGVLAHTHFGELVKVEAQDKAPPRYLGRHIVIGTVIHSRRSSMNIMPNLGTVADMQDKASSLRQPRPSGHNAYPVNEKDGMI